MTVFELFLNKVSTPPTFCSNLDTESNDCFVIAPNAAPTPATAPAVIARPFFAALLILDTPALNPDSSIFVSNFKEPS